MTDQPNRPAWTQPNADELAGDLAHEINNRIAIMLGFAQTLLSQLPPEDLRRPALEQIEREALHCRHAVRNLSSLARPKPPNRQPIGINEIAQLALKAVQQQTQMQAIQIQSTWTDAPLYVLADGNQLEQALVNLLHCVAQAMPHGGILSIATSRQSDHAQLYVGYTGNGLDPHQVQLFLADHRAELNAANGTRLNLIIGQQIIAQHGGTLGIEPGVDAHHRFLIALPLPSHGQTM